MSDKLTYKDAGVDVERGYEAVKLMKEHTKRTMIPGVIGDLGSFGGFFELPAEVKNPVLVSGTDGVGTKLQLAFMAGKHDTVGIDAVAMCVNDVACHGARPLFFLDYIGTGRLLPNQAADIVKGVCDGCVQAGCALIGGETAEMPGFYQDEEYDLAGFCVGIVDREKIVNGSTITSGNVLIGIPSTGVHSNGFSLVRKLFFDVNKCTMESKFEELGDKTLGEVLLTPTRIYVKLILEMVEKYKINGIAHITGGGFIENIPRIIPKGLKAIVNIEDVPVLPIFRLMQRLGGIETKEMFNTFNMGIGLVMAVDQAEEEAVLTGLKALGENPVVIGRVEEGEGGIELC